MRTPRHRVPVRMAQGQVNCTYPCTQDCSLLSSEATDGGADSVDGRAVEATKAVEAHAVHSHQSIESHAVSSKAGHSAVGTIDGCIRVHVRRGREGWRRLAIVGAVCTSREAAIAHQAIDAESTGEVSVESKAGTVQAVGGTIGGSAAGAIQCGVCSIHRSERVGNAWTVTVVFEGARSSNAGFLVRVEYTSRLVSTL